MTAQPGENLIERLRMLHGNFQDNYCAGARTGHRVEILNTEATRALCTEAADEIELFRSALEGKEREIEVAIDENKKMFSQLVIAKARVISVEAQLSTVRQQALEERGKLIDALQGSLAEWDKFTRYGSPMAKAANERIAHARDVLALANAGFLSPAPLSEKGSTTEEKRGGVEGVRPMNPFTHEYED